MNAQKLASAYKSCNQDRESLSQVLLISSTETSITGQSFQVGEKVSLQSANQSQLYELYATIDKAEVLFLKLTFWFCISMIIYQKITAGVYSTWSFFQLFGKRLYITAKNNLITVYSYKPHSFQYFTQCGCKCHETHSLISSTITFWINKVRIKRHWPHSNSYEFKLLLNTAAMSRLAYILYFLTFIYHKPRVLLAMVS